MDFLSFWVALAGFMMFSRFVSLWIRLFWELAESTDRKDFSESLKTKQYYFVLKRHCFLLQEVFLRLALLTLHVIGEVLYFGTATCVLRNYYLKDIL